MGPGQARAEPGFQQPAGHQDPVGSALLPVVGSGTVLARILFLFLFLGHLVTSWTNLSAADGKIRTNGLILYPPVGIIVSFGTLPA